jgi:hypothetical protein
MSRGSDWMAEGTRSSEGAPIKATTSMLDHSISRNSSSADRTLNSLINIYATLMLVAILASFQLHIRRSPLHLQPAGVEIGAAAQHFATPRMLPICLPFKAPFTAQSGSERKRQLTKLAGTTPTGTKVSAIRLSNCVSSALLP